MSDFSNFKALSNVGKTEVLPHTNEYLEEMSNAKETNLDILRSIIGDHTVRDIKVFDITDDSQRLKYVKLINKAGIDIDSEDTQHGVKEFRDETSSNKEPYYIKIVSYIETSYDMIFKNMTEYLAKIQGAEPPVTDPSGMRILFEAWEYLFGSIPAVHKPKFFEVSDKMKVLTKEIQERSDKQSDVTDSDIAKVISRIDSRNTLKDKVDLSDIGTPVPENEDGDEGTNEADSNEVTEGKSDKPKIIPEKVLEKIISKSTGTEIKVKDDVEVVEAKKPVIKKAPKAPTKKSGKPKD